MHFDHSFLVTKDVQLVWTVLLLLVCILVCVKVCVFVTFMMKCLVIVLQTNFPTGTNKVSVYLLLKQIQIQVCAKPLLIILVVHSRLHMHLTYIYDSTPSSFPITYKLLFVDNRAATNSYFHY